MDVSLTDFLIVCPLVFLGGFVDSIAGGGGLITLPGFIMTGMPMHLVLGTNKLSAMLGTLVASLRYITKGYVRWHLALCWGRAWC